MHNVSIVLCAWVCACVWVCVWNQRVGTKMRMLVWVQISSWT